MLHGLVRQRDNPLPTWDISFSTDTFVAAMHRVPRVIPIIKVMMMLTKKRKKYHQRPLEVMMVVPCSSPLVLDASHLRHDERWTKMV